MLEARGPGGEPKSCLFCSRRPRARPSFETENKSGGIRVALKMLMRYLKIDDDDESLNYSSVFLTNEPDDDELMMVPLLCDKCGPVISEFWQIYQSLERLRLQLDNRLHLLHNFIEEGDEEKELTCKEEAENISKNPKKQSHAKIIQKLRAQVKKECSSKIKSSLPRVLGSRPLLPATLGLPQNPELSALIGKTRKRIMERIRIAKSQRQRVQPRKSAAARSSAEHHHHHHNHHHHHHHNIPSVDVNLLYPAPTMDEGPPPHEHPAAFFTHFLDMDTGSSTTSSASGAGPGGGSAVKPTSSSNKSSSKGSGGSGGGGGGGKFACTVCGKCWRDNYKLQRHMRSHMKPEDRETLAIERKFQCEQCSSWWPDRYKLTRHMKTHSQEKLYKCAECPVSLRDSPHLKRHIIRLHPYSYLKNHLPPGISEEHTLAALNSLGDTCKVVSGADGEKPYGCPHCRNRCSKVSLLRDHLFQTHVQEVVRFIVNKQI